jgi:hypothetical protein
MLLCKGRTTRFRLHYHPVRGYVVNSIQRRTVTTCLKHRSSDVQSAEYSASQEFYIERGAKNAMNGKLEYEYFRLQNLKDVLNRTFRNHLLKLT